MELKRISKAMRKGLKTGSGGERGRGSSATERCAWPERSGMCVDCVALWFSGGCLWS